MTNPLSVVFSAPGLPADSECATITILDDSALEGDHDFSVTIIDVGPFALLDPLSTTTIVVIMDEESESESSI